MVTVRSGHYSNLIKQLEDSGLEHREFALPLGRVRLIVYGTLLTNSTVLKNIDELAYLPLKFTLTDNYNEVQMRLFSYFIQDYMYHNYGYKVQILYSDKLVDEETKTYNIEYIPVLARTFAESTEDLDNQMIYLPYEQVASIKTNLDFLKLVDRLPVGSNPLIQQIFLDNKDLYESYEDLDNYQGIYHVKLPVGIPSIENYREYYAELLRSYLLDDYHCISVGDSLATTTKDLLHLLDATVVNTIASDDTNITHIIAKGKEEFGAVTCISSLPVMVKENLSRIESNKIPIVRLSGPWQLKLPITAENRARLTFSLLKIIKAYPILIPHYQEVVVAHDLAVTLPLINKEIALKITKALINDLEHLTQYTAIQVDNLENALAMRYAINKLRQYAITSYINGYVITNATLNTSQIPVEPEHLNKLKLELRQRLIRSYGKICNGDRDPVSLVSFDEMSLVDLVSIVQPEANNRYCYTIETIGRLNNKISPFTMRPFPSWLNNILNNLSIVVDTFIPTVDKHIVGLFELEDFDSATVLAKIGLEPILRNISMLYRIDEVDEGNNVTSVSIIANPSNFGDSIIDQLTSIKSKLVAADYKLLEDRWFKGEYLNIWGIITTLYLNKLSRPYLMPNSIINEGMGTPSQVNAIINKIRFQ